MTTSPPDSRKGDRIAKLLARAGVASRRDVERMIADGRVAIDGVAVTTPATLLTSLAGVSVDGKPVAAAEPTRLWLFHKPAGCVTTSRDPQGRPTVFDILDADLPRVLTVGRLDFNTEGLLLLTNDGGLKRALELPATGMERMYRVRVRGFCDVAKLAALRSGVVIDGMRYGSVIARQESRSGANAWLSMTIREGKNREVRRICEHLGLQVTRLIRVGYGPFALDELPRGEVSECSAGEVKALVRQLASGARPAPQTPRAPRADHRR